MQVSAETDWYTKCTGITGIYSFPVCLYFHAIETKTIMKDIFKMTLTIMRNQTTLYANWIRQFLESVLAKSSSIFLKKIHRQFLGQLTKCLRPLVIF